MHPSARARMVYQQALYPNLPTYNTPQPDGRPPSNRSMRRFQARQPIEDEFYSDESSSCDSDCSCCDDTYEDQYVENGHFVNQYQFHTAGHRRISGHQMMNQSGRSSRQTMARGPHEQWAPNNQSRHRLHRRRDGHRVTHCPNVATFHPNQQQRQSHNQTMDMQQRRYSQQCPNPGFSMSQRQHFEPQNPPVNIQQQPMNDHQFQLGTLMYQAENPPIENQLNNSYRPTEGIIYNPTVASMPGLALHRHSNSIQPHNSLGFQNRPNFVNMQMQHQMIKQPQLRPPGNQNQAMNLQMNVANPQYQNYHSPQINRDPGVMHYTSQPRNLNQLMHQTYNQTNSQIPYPALQTMTPNNLHLQSIDGTNQSIRGSNNMPQLRMNSSYAQQPVKAIQPGTFNAPQPRPQDDTTIGSQSANAFQDENAESAKMLYMMAKPSQAHQIQPIIPPRLNLEPTAAVLHNNEASKAEMPLRRDNNAIYSEVNKSKKKLVTFDIAENQTVNDKETQRDIAQQRNDQNKLQTQALYNAPIQEDAVYEDPVTLMQQSNKSSDYPKPVKLKEKRKAKKSKQVQKHERSIPTNTDESIYEDPQEILQGSLTKLIETKVPQQNVVLENMSSTGKDSEETYRSLGKPLEINEYTEPIYDHLSSMLTNNTSANQTSTSKQLGTETYLENAQIMDTYMQLCKQNGESNPPKAAVLHDFLRTHFPLEPSDSNLTDATENVANFDKTTSLSGNDIVDTRDKLTSDKSDSDVDIFDFENIIIENDKVGDFEKSIANEQSDISESESDDSSSSEDDGSESSSEVTSSYVSDSDVTSSDDSIGKSVVVQSQLTMERELWRQCVRWLIDTGVISHLHKMSQPEAVVFDLAQTLRDGVVLFNLLNVIKPGAVDPNSINLRPQMLQFLCVQNLWAVKNSLHVVFKIPEEDLFLPSDLFNMTNVAKVLRSLSILSQLPCAASKYRPFPDMGIHRNSTHRTDEEEDIYKNLSDMASERELMDEEEDLYDCVAEEKEEGIYGTLIASKPLPSAPKDKRSFCISEIYETEKNYVQHLNMMRDKFIHPFKSSMSDKDIKSIFINLEQLNPVHKDVLSEIEKYKNDGSKMSRAFLNHKDGFLLYGTYCSNLADAQEYLATLMKHNDQTRALVEDCQSKASPSKFKLRELLMVPMQRILKYHLLVKELNKCTTDKHQDKPDLIKALDSMQEISQYVNEVKRDSETLVTINQVERCLVDYTNGLPLSTYGRLLKDGELKIKMYNDKAIKTRNSFLFDQALFMTREKNGNYILKDLIRLDEYKLDEISVGPAKGGKWSFNWTLTAVTGTNSFILSAKAKADKIKWVEKLKQAFDNIQPHALKGKPHSFKMHSFNEPTYCDSCHKLLLGSFYQGYICEKTDVKCHKTCLLNALKLVENNEGVDRMRISDYPASTRRPNIPPEPPSRKMQPPLPNMIPETTPYKAHRRYSGLPHPPFSGNTITFDIGEHIEVTEHTSSDWWKGYSLTYIERRGYFPASHVSPVTKRESTQRRDNYMPSNNIGINNYPSPQPSIRPPINTRIIPIEDNIWYAGQLDRDGAAKLLSGRPTGTFLVRTRGGNMAISLLYQSDIKHIKIVKSSENLFYVAECKHFKSVQELVQFYQENSMSSSFLGLETTLKYPYRDPTLFPGERSSHRVERTRSHISERLGSPPHHNPRQRMSLPQPDNHSPLPSNGVIRAHDGSVFEIMSKAKVLFDFEPRSPQELGLKAGQIVNIISKAGDAHGWWKGEHKSNIGYFPATFIEEL